MKNLLLSSIFILLLSGCYTGHYNKLISLEQNTTPTPPPLFYNHSEAFLFKTNITLYNKNFSGLLITKQIQPENYRVIFTTELGMKLFDMEFTDTSYTLQYCIPQLNRPKLINTIKEDIRILLMSDLNNKVSQSYTDKANNYLVKKIQDGNYENYYFFNIKTAAVSQIEQAKGAFKKATFILSNYQNDVPTKINIRHHTIKLNIELTLLEK